MSPGPWQIAIIALLIIVLFGASRLGDIGKGLGDGIRNFKKGIADDKPEAKAVKQAASTSQTAASGEDKPTSAA